MDKSKLLNMLGVVVLTVFTVLMVGGFKTGQAPVGGTFNSVPVEFSQGITVGGTEVINNSGQFTGGLNTVLASVIGSATVGLNYFKPVYAPAADATLTTARTNSIVKMNTAGEDITLPAVASSNGVSYRFVVTGAVATTNMTVVSAEGDNIEGSLIVAGAVVDCDANDVVTFVIDGENIGDFFDLYSDGTSWLIGASGGLTAGKMTCSG